MKQVQRTFRRASRVWKKLQNCASLPIRAGRVFAREGVGGCIDRVRHRLSRQAIRLEPSERYARWRAEFEMNLRECAAAPPEITITVVLLAIEPAAERLDRVLSTIAREAAALPGSETLAVVVSRDPVVRALAQSAASDGRAGAVRIIDDVQNLARAANELIGGSHGDYLLLTDSDSILGEAALCRIGAAQRAHPNCAVVYGDHDSITDGGERIDPFFKPDYSPELLHSFNYIGATALLSRSLFDAIGGLRSMPDRAFAYDLLLRALDRSPLVHHVREILSHQLPPAPTGQPRSSAAALTAAFERRGTVARVDPSGPRTTCRFELTADPLVSVIIPSDDAENSIECLTRLLAATRYPRLEVLLVTNSRVAARVDAAIADIRVRCVAYDRPFNFSDKCNAGACAAHGAYFVFFNDDVAPLASDWVEALLEYAQQPGIGGVSPRMLYENGTIQYAGMVTGVRDFVGTAFHCRQADDEGYHGLINSVRNVSILCGACQMVSREAFAAIGGWNARDTPIAHSDLSFSFELLQRGLRLVYTPLAEMRHVGARSRKSNITWQHLDDAAHYFVLNRYGARLSDDPFFPSTMRAIAYDDASRYRLYAPSETAASAAMPPRRILLITHELSLSGAPMIVLEIARHLKAIGWGVCVVSPRDGKLRAAYETEGIPVIVDEWILESPRAAGPLWSAFDLVVANTVLAWRCILEAVRIGMPNVFFVHESEFGARYIESQPSAERAFADADVVLFPSAMTLELYAPFRDDALHLEFLYGIRNIEAAKAGPAAPFGGGRIGQEKIGIVHSGTIEPRKGQDLLIEAVRRLPENLRGQIEVSLLGRDDDPNRREFVQQVKRQAAGLPVEFVGELSRDEALARLASSDLFVCASTEETGPLVVFEAMALGKPVISTRVGAAAQVIAEGESGFLVDVGDVDVLRDRLSALILAGDAERTRMGRTGRKIFEEQLRIERMGARLCEVFEEVLARRRGNRSPALVTRAA